eukprot:29991-Pelagococcus_subviridis.AAC.2
MYCFSVVLPPPAAPAPAAVAVAASSSVLFDATSNVGPEDPGNSDAPANGTSASSIESIALALLNSASNAAADSIGFIGSVPIARSNENRLSALFRKYPNMIDAAYICAACSFDIRTIVFEYAVDASGPSIPRRCSFTISNASTECTPFVSWFKSTPRMMSVVSSSGGSMSTPISTSSPPFLGAALSAAFPSPSSFVTSITPFDALSASSISSHKRSSVASTAASKSCGSLSRTCASSWPCGDPGSIGAPSNPGAFGGSFAAARGGAKPRGARLAAARVFAPKTRAAREEEEDATATRPRDEELADDDLPTTTRGARARGGAGASAARELARIIASRGSRVAGADDAVGGRAGDRARRVNCRAGEGLGRKSRQRSPRRTRRR